MNNDGKVEVPNKIYTSPQEVAMKDCCTREQTAREVLTEHVEQLELTLRQLRALLAALPMELPHLADRALKRILRPDRFQ